MLHFQEIIVRFSFLKRPMSVRVGTTKSNRAYGRGARLASRRIASAKHFFGMEEWEIVYLNVARWPKRLSRVLCLALIAASRHVGVAAFFKAHPPKPNWVHAIGRVTIDVLVEVYPRCTSRFA